MILDNKIKFRRATRSQHFCDLVDVHLDVFSGGVQEVPSRTLVGCAWWVGYNSSGPVAFAGIHPSKQFLKTAYLCRVGVLDEARGQGIQKKLIRIREKWARGQGYEWLMTDSNLDTPASGNSLISCGYKLWRPYYRWAGYEPAQYWKKYIGKIS